MIENPRGDCLRWLAENRATGAVRLPKRPFDAFVGAGAFDEGPPAGTSGRGYGEPYCPDRQAWGRLKDGRYVYCELNEGPSSHPEPERTDRCPRSSLPHPPPCSPS